MQVRKKTSSLYAHALINNYYINSAYRLVGGSSQIADALATEIQNYGGSIFTEREVDQFVFENDKLTGVKTTNGEVFIAKNIISNIHPTKTLQKIEETQVRKSYRNRISNIQNTISVFGLHLKMRPGSFPYLPYNYYHYTVDDVWPVSNYSKDNWPNFYYLYTPATNNNDSHSECVSIYAYMQFEEIKQWAKYPSIARGTEYKEWKTQKANTLIESVEQTIS